MNGLRCRGLTSWPAGEERSRLRQAPVDPPSPQPKTAGTVQESYPMAINTRHRDKSGEIGRKHGNTLLRTLRKTYGQSFAEGCSDNEKLSDVLHKLDEPSLTRLIDDHDAGYLVALAD